MNPQWLAMTTIDPLATYADVETPIPIQRLPDRGGRSQVMEILKVEFGFGANSHLTISALVDQFFNLYLTTRSFLTSEPTAAQQTGSLIAKYQWSHGTNGAGTLTNAWVMGPAGGNMLFDLTDGAGHGVLVATDSLYFGAIQTAGASPITGNTTCRILYRWKNVGLAEYVGLVQSQQS